MKPHWRKVSDIVQIAIILLICTQWSAPPALAQVGLDPALPRTQPLDPLTAQERSTAERVARADARVRDLLGDHARLAHLEFFSIKPTDEKTSSARHAELLFSRPDGDFGGRVVVRLTGTPAVVTVERIDARNVPLTDAEIEEAWKIALADPAVRSRIQRDLAGIIVEGLRLYSEDAQDPCSKGRCIYLLLRVGNYYLNQPAITVDLASRRVLPERRN